jgi:hypothetical protein
VNGDRVLVVVGGGAKSVISVLSLSRTARELLARATRQNTILKTKN